MLSERKIPVFLTLDWGDEVEDPHAKAKKGELEKKPGASKPDASKPDASKPEASKPEASKPGASKAEASTSAAALSAAAAGTQPAEGKVVDPAEKAGQPASQSENAPKPGAESPPQSVSDASVRPADPGASGKRAGQEAQPAQAVEWTYEQPLRVREELRRQWEETRDCALRLSEANAILVFGSGKLAPKDVLDHVRTLIEKGLSVDVAQRALTSEAAALLGVSKSLGKVEAGFDATLALWTKHPLTHKDAKLAWLFVDGFPYEFDLKTTDLQGKPDEGVDATGTWTLEFDTPEAKPAIAELTMSKDGGVKGTIRYKNPTDDKESTGEFEGRVAGKKLKIAGKVKIGNFEAQVEIEGEIEGDTMTGSTAWKFSGAEDSRRYTATRKPKGAEDEP